MLVRLRWNIFKIHIYIYIYDIDMQIFDPDFERCFNYFLIIDQVRANDRIVWPSSFDGNWRTSERIILSSRHNFFKGGEKRQKRRKEDERKMATIKYPDDRPKKNSRRAKSERQKWNISRPFDNLFRAFVYNITKRCRSRKRGIYECGEEESDERMNRVHFSLSFE